MFLRSTLATMTILLSCACPITGGADERDPALFEENFDPALHDGWSWAREDPAAWKIEKSALIIRVQPGYLHADAKEKDRTKNVLLRDLPADSTLPVAVEVCVENDPQVQFEHAGVIWYLDDANFVDLLHEGFGGKGSILMVTKKANQPHHDTAACNSKLLWLRLVISGDDITGQFRESPTDAWHTVAKRKLPSPAKARVGVICGGGANDSDRVAKFSRFRIVQLGK